MHKVHQELIFTAIAGIYERGISPTTVHVGGSASYCDTDLCNTAGRTAYSWVVMIATSVILSVV